MPRRDKKEHKSNLSEQLASGPKFETGSPVVRIESIALQVGAVCIFKNIQLSR